MRFAIYVFDAYGTLFDVHSAVERHREEIGARADQFSELWRVKQLEYTWMRSLTGSYRDFRACTRDALDFVSALIGGISPELCDKLMGAYERLDAYADVAATLAALRDKGAKTAILSNGTPSMLAAAVESAGLHELLDAVLSVDQVGVFKTDPRTYGLVHSHFGCAPHEVSFQSSNRWDVAGAAKYGFRTVWINRAGRPDEYHDFPPDVTLGSLAALAAEP